MQFRFGISPFLKESFFLFEMPFRIVNDLLLPLVDFGCLHSFSDGTIKLVDQRDEALVIRIDFRDTYAHSFVPFEIPLGLLHYEYPRLSV
jgi:hypothetical protein